MLLDTFARTNPTSLHIQYIQRPLFLRIIGREDSRMAAPGSIMENRAGRDDGNMDIYIFHIDRRIDS